MDRFWDKVERTDECWEWKAALNANGYGAFYYEGRMQLAHRVAFALTHEDGATAEVVRHKCDNPSCVRPEHLEAGTQADNLRDMRSRGRAAPNPSSLRTHCPQGHPYNGENTRVRNGKRVCRVCDCAKVLRYRARKMVNR